MSQVISPSPIVESFVRNVREDLPAEESAKIHPFEEAISHTTSAADKERAHMCLRWAIDMSDDKNQSHPRWHQIKELHEEWKDTLFGAEFGLTQAGVPHTPGEDIHFQWVENAVLVAKTLGQEHGRDSSWTHLLEDLVQVEDA